MRQNTVARLLVRYLDANDLWSCLQIFPEWRLFGRFPIALSEATDGESIEKLKTAVQKNESNVFIREGGPTCPGAGAMYYLNSLCQVDANNVTKLDLSNQCILGSEYMELFKQVNEASVWPNLKFLLASVTMPVRNSRLSTDNCIAPPQLEELVLHCLQVQLQEDLCALTQTLEYAKCSTWRETAVQSHFYLSEASQGRCEQLTVPLHSGFFKELMNGTGESPRFKRMKQLILECVRTADTCDDRVVRLVSERWPFAEIMLSVVDGDQAYFQNFKLPNPLLRSSAGDQAPLQPAFVKHVPDDGIVGCKLSELSSPKTPLDASDLQISIDFHASTVSASNAHLMHIVSSGHVRQLTVRISNRRYIELTWPKLQLQLRSLYADSLKPMLKAAETSLNSLILSADLLYGFDNNDDSLLCFKSVRSLKIEADAFLRKSKMQANPPCGSLPCSQLVPFFRQFPVLKSLTIEHNRLIDWSNFSSILEVCPDLRYLNFDSVCPPPSQNLNTFLRTPTDNLRAVILTFNRKCDISSWLPNRCYLSLQYLYLQVRGGRLPQRGDLLKLFNSMPRLRWLIVTGRAEKSAVFHRMGDNKVQEHRGKLHAHLTCGTGLKAFPELYGVFWRHLSTRRPARSVQQAET